MFRAKRQADSVGEIYWLDGSKVQTSLYDIGTDFSGGEENVCIYYNGVENVLRDYHCRYRFTYICQFSCYDRKGRHEGRTTLNLNQMTTSELRHLKL